MTRLLLVRHGQAHDTGIDPGLSALGVTQIRQLGERLAEIPVTAIRHSPRRRAAESAARLGASLGVPVRADDLLDDRTPVPGPGREGDYPQWLHGWLAAVPAAERDHDGGWLSAAVDRYSLGDDGHLVLVTHAFVVAWFVRHALRAPTSGWTTVEAANAGLTTIDYRPGRPPHLLGVNDVGHLRPAR